METWIGNYRYVPMQEPGGSVVRDYLMSEASSDFVLCLDCHVLMAPGSIARLIDYFRANPQTNDLLQGPMLLDNLTSFATHMEPIWRGDGVFGAWGADKRGLDPEAAPFEIPMHGLGLYACRRAAWPGFNPHFRGLGGGEGYIHEKFRRAGGRIVCLPFLRWLHRFPRPLGVPYKLSWHDRVKNYLLGFEELGWPTEPIIEHFRELIGDSSDVLMETIRREMEDLR